MEKNVFYETSDGSLINVSDIAYIYKYNENDSTYCLWFKQSMNQYAKNLILNENDYINIRKIIRQSFIVYSDEAI